MNHVVKQKLEQFRDAIVEQIAWVTPANTMLQITAGATQVFPSEQKLWCVVVMPGTYVTTSRRYKAISRKELLAIVNNEREFLSPFEESRSVYRVTENDEGGWLVDFYFVDLQRYAQLKDVFAVIPGDQLIQNLSDAAQGLTRYCGDLGDFLVYQNQGAWVVKRFSERLLQSLQVEQDQSQERTINYAPLDCSRSLTKQILASTFWSQRGVIQWALVPAWLKLTLAKPKLWTNLAIGLIAWVAVQFLYLTASDWLITHEASSSADIRRAYAAAKTEYLSDLDQLVAMQGLLADRSQLYRLGGLFEVLKNSGEVTLNRFEYRDGEFQIGGLTDDIDTLTRNLSDFEGVSGVDFNSPVRPDRSGLDQFDLRFEIANE
jgi:hypothetical protein